MNNADKQYRLRRTRPAHQDSTADTDLGYNRGRCQSLTQLLRCYVWHHQTPGDSDGGGGQATHKVVQDCSRLVELFDGLLDSVHHRLVRQDDALLSPHSLHLHSDQAILTVQNQNIKVTFTEISGPQIRRTMEKGTVCPVDGVSLAIQVILEQQLANHHHHFLLILSEDTKTITEQF